MKKILQVLFYIMLFAVATYAAEQTLASVGAGAATETTSFLKSWKWVFAVVALVVPIAVAMWTWNKISEQEGMDTNGQGQAKFMKPAKTFGAFIAGLAVIYFIYGSFSVMYLKKDFSSGWSVLVADFFVDAFN